MATAALDYFLSCIPIPSTTTVPTSGSILFDYLLRRQLDSLGTAFVMVAKFLAWTNRPDTLSSRHPLPGPFLGPLPSTMPTPGLQELTVPEFRATVASLTAGSPVVLGLIYVGPGRLGGLLPAVSIWNNHQVLAYGTANVSPTVTNLRIYDPNEPGDDGVLIRCELLGGGIRVRCTQVKTSRGMSTNVRGFFRMPYTRVTPPCLP